ncbi:Chromobox -like protein 3 [Trichinella sp. T6]|nr:Chromobox -like protein 3 [Trichinella sp. T6]
MLQRKNCTLIYFVLCIRYHVKMPRPKKSESEARRPSVPSDTEIEEVVDRKVINKKVNYLVKYVDFPLCDKDWVPAESLKCISLIAEFESKRTTLDRAVITQSSSKVAKPRKGQENLQTLIDRGYVPDKIIDSIDLTGEVMYLVKFLRSSKTGIFSEHDVKETCPNLITKFVMESDEE